MRVEDGDAERLGKLERLAVHAWRSQWDDRQRFEPREQLYRCAERDPVAAHSLANHAADLVRQQRGRHEVVSSSAGVTEQRPGTVAMLLDKEQLRHHARIHSERG